LLRDSNWCFFDIFHNYIKDGFVFTFHTRPLKSQNRPWLKIHRTNMLDTSHSLNSFYRYHNRCIERFVDKIIEEVFEKHLRLSYWQVIKLKGTTQEKCNKEDEKSITNQSADVSDCLFPFLLVSVNKAAAFNFLHNGFYQK